MPNKLHLLLLSTGLLLFGLIMLWAIWQTNPRDPASGRGLIKSLHQPQMTFRQWVLLMIAFALMTIGAAVQAVGLLCGSPVFSNAAR